MTSTFLWRHYFPQYFQLQRQALEIRVYCHLKPLKTEALELAEAFHCSFTITGTQGCLAAAVLGEALSPLHPSVNGALKAIWLFVASGISPQVESRVSDEDSIGEENKWHMMGGGAMAGIIFSAVAEGKRSTKSKHVHYKCMKNILHVRVKLF